MAEAEIAAKSERRTKKRKANTKGDAGPTSPVKRQRSAPTASDKPLKKIIGSQKSKNVRPDKDNKKPNQSNSKSNDGTESPRPARKVKPKGKPTATGGKTSTSTTSNSSLQARGAAKAMTKYKGKVNKKEKPAPKILTNKEAHAELKSRRLQRRQNDRSHYDVTVEMKQIWEDLRKHNLAKDKRNELSQKVMTLVTGKERDFVFAHDTTRIFQTLCKYADAATRSTLFDSLKESVLEMVKSKYSVFFVRSLLRRGTKEERNFIIEKLMSNARRLISHKTAGPVLEFAYNDYANAAQRLAFCQQFYGPSFVWQTPGVTQTLEQVLEQKPDKRGMILKHMSDALQSIVEKEALAFTFVHNLLYEYLRFADLVEKQAMAECLQEHLSHIVHTREGAKAAAYAVWYSSAKGRKVIMKHIKPYVETLVKEEYGHLVLIALLDAVDDTKLLSKLLLQPIAEKLGEALQDKWARKCIIYLLDPRNPSYCNREVRDFLSLGDGNPFSKKDMDKRQKELQEEFCPHLIAYCVSNLDTLCADTQLAVILGLVFSCKAGDTRELSRAIIRLYSAPYTADSAHILDSKLMRVVRTRMLKSDTTGEVRGEFLDALPQQTVESFVNCENGRFLLAGLLEGCTDSKGKKTVMSVIEKHKKRLQAGEDKSSSALLAASGL